MAVIDIFALEETKISRDLKGKYLLIYGQPKVGKTTFCSKLPRCLFCSFEQGVNALPGVKSVPLANWTDFKKVVTQLKKPQGREMYDSLAIDTVDVAWALCEKFICQRQNVDSIRDIAWGGGYKMLSDEFSETFRELTLLGYGITFVSHAKERATEARDEEGNAINAMAPSVPSRCYDIINAMVDVIGYVGVVKNPENGVMERYLYTRQTPTVFAGSRYQYLASKIPFGYNELVNAIGDAIDKSVELDGAKVSDESVTINVTKRPFNEVMEEAKNIWTSYINNATDEENKVTRLAMLKDIVKRVFGDENAKISAAVPSQQDLVEYFISEVKEIM